MANVTDPNFQNQFQVQFNKQQKKKADCEAKGGVWDEASQTCRLPNLNDPAGNTAAAIQGGQLKVSKPQDAVPTQPSKPTSDVTYKFGKEGTVAITGADGTTVNLTREQYNKYSNLRKLGFEPSSQADPVSQALSLPTRAKLQSQQVGQMASTLTDQPVLTEQDILNAVPQEGTLEGVTTAGGALAGALAGGGTGAAIGAGIGSAILPVAGTAAGAAAGSIIGALLGAIGGAYTKIGLDQRQDVKQAKKVGTLANKNFGQTIDMLNAGLLTPDQALTRWNNDRTSLYAARENLKRQTDTDLNRFLSNGADELAQIEDYINDYETIYTFEFAQALANPNPKNVRYLYQNAGVIQDE